MGGAERKISIKEVYRQEEEEITIEEIRLLYKISYVIYTKKIYMIGILGGYGKGGGYLKELYPGLARRVARRGARAK